MSTSCSISVQQGDKVLSVYCHHDGYPSGVGALLTAHYNSQDGADAIVALGDMSYLDKSVDKPVGHCYDLPVQGFSIFYGRDRGEHDTEARVYDSYEESIRRNSEEYNYFWDGEKWLLDGLPIG